MYGSIILAGILLKLGGLGILRLNSVITARSVFNTFIIVSLLGLALIGAICIYTTDLKKIIAFSSVSHIAFTIVFLIGVNKVRGVSCILIMISHAFRSSGIFLIVYLFYLSTNSRNILVSIGILTIYPHVAFLWLIIVISSIGGPPAINLLAEVWCVIYSFTLFYKIFLLIVLGFILSRAYHIILYSSVCQRDSSWYLRSFRVNTISRSFGPEHELIQAPKDPIPDNIIAMEPQRIRAFKIVYFNKENSEDAHIRREKLLLEPEEKEHMSPFTYSFD